VPPSAVVGPRQAAGNERQPLCLVAGADAEYLNRNRLRSVRVNTPSQAKGMMSFRQNDILG